MTEQIKQDELVEELKLSADQAGDVVACAKALIDEHEKAVDAFLDEENNQGLLFHIAGFDGDKQQEIAEFYRDVYDVEVF